jgi:hypothetical protein
MTKLMMIRIYSMHGDLDKADDDQMSTRHSP